MSGATGYHWIVTVCLSDNTLATHSGISTGMKPSRYGVGPSHQTRAEVYEQAMAEVQAKHPDVGFAVTYFELAPNDLTGGV